MISTRDEVTSARVEDAFGMFFAIEAMKSAFVPVIPPPIKSVSYTSSVSHSETSGKPGPLEQKEEQG